MTRGLCRVDLVVYEWEGRPRFGHAYCPIHIEKLGDPDPGVEYHVERRRPKTFYPAAPQDVELAGWERCGRCRGNGFVLSAGEPGVRRTEKCPVCHGHGTVNKKRAEVAS